MIEYLPWVLIFLLLKIVLFLIYLGYRVMGGAPIFARRKKAVPRGGEPAVEAKLEDFNDEAFEEAEAILIDQRLTKMHPELPKPLREAAVREIMDAARTHLGRVGKVAQE